jgi:hypothetical protein
MAVTEFSPIGRRAFIAGAAATSVLALPGCAGMGGLSLIDAVRRLLERSSQGAFARLTAPGGFYDNQMTRLDLPDVLGSRGNILQNILTSVVLKGQLQRGFNGLAEAGARRAAPLVVDAVRTIGIGNAVALIQGGPTAATGFLRTAMAGKLIETMVPALGEGMRLASDPVIGQALAGLTGVDISGIAQTLSVKADNAIWGEIGREETSIRANPRATNDAVLIAALEKL